MTDRPPLGLRPRFVANSLRVQEIAETMHRYARANATIPAEWVEELAELTDWQRRRSTSAATLARAYGA